MQHSTQLEEPFLFLFWSTVFYNPLGFYESVSSVLVDCTNWLVLLMETAAR